MPRAWTFDVDSYPIFEEYGTFAQARAMLENLYAIQIKSNGTVIGTGYYPNGDFGWIANADSNATMSFTVTKRQKSYFNSYVRVDENDYAQNSYINRGDSLFLSFRGVGGGEVGTFYKFFFPEIQEYSAVDLYVGTKGETYYDSAYATLACGYVGTRTISDVATVYESKTRKGNTNLFEDVFLRENIRWSPRKYFENFSASDYINTISVKLQSGTSWLFAPDYRILVDLNNSGEFATTNWHERVIDYGNVDKAQKHWSGNYEVSEWSPTFADPYNEMYGSLYTSSIDGRDKLIMMRAMVKDRPLIWHTQFTGRIKQTSWKDGKLTVKAQDEIRGLPDNEFVYDYQNLGTVISGKSYGVVKAIVGTEVMFDDKGEVSYIVRKQKTSANWFNIAWNTVLAAHSAVSGNFVGVGLSGLNIAVELGKGGEKITNSYTQIQDDNLIPDDSVFGGVLKFFGGSFAGTADNKNSPLYQSKEYRAVGGTFVNGLYATLSFDDVSGIKIGDYVYARKPLLFSGNPNEVIRAILCGSNITNKYSYPSVATVGDEVTKSWFGRNAKVVSKNDFDSNWNSEFSPLAQMSIWRIVDESSPFEEIKKIAESCQFYFYINADNKFAVSVLNGKDVLKTATNISTYSQTYGNILDGFEFNRSTEDAYGGLTYRYGFDEKRNTFSKKIELYNKYSQFAGKPKEIEAYWINDDDDAYVLAHRALMRYGTGVDTARIPTSLYGILNNVGDLIRVQHTYGSLNYNTFEIVSQGKRFGNSEISFDAESVEYVNAQGIAEWGNGFGTYVSTSKNTWSCVGRNGDSIGTVGTLSSAITVFGTYVSITGDKSAYSNRYVCFGSNSFGRVEIAALRFLSRFGGITTFAMTRGLFNTVSRPLVAGDSVYDCGPISLKAGYTTVTREGLQPNSISGIQFATTQGINTAIGTSFRFF